MIGRIGDRPGSFVLQVIGIHRGGTVQGAWSVIPGSATGNLRGLQGEGSFIAPSGQPESWQFALDYDFDSAERTT